LKNLVGEWGLEIEVINEDLGFRVES